MRKVISGGQTGVDRAALLAAKFIGLRTGGWMPKGWRALDGCHPDFAEKYAMRECELINYRHRTELNVKHSDGTLRLAHTFTSPGELCTMKAIKRIGKPFIDVAANEPRDLLYVINWIDENEIETLNVAGNSEQTAPGIQKFAFGWLVALFALYLQLGKDQ